MERPSVGGSHVPSRPFPIPAPRRQLLARHARPDEENVGKSLGPGPREAAAAALAASVAFFRSATPGPPAPSSQLRPRGFLMIIRDLTGPLVLSATSFVFASNMPRLLLAAAISVFVFAATHPRSRPREDAAVQAAPGGEAQETPSGNSTADFAEVSLLNTAVQEMWPEITSFIRTVLKETVEEAIQTRVPWFLSSLGFGRISFGDSALKVEELNVERTTQTSHKDGEVRSFKVSSLVAWDADVDVALTAPTAVLSAEHVLVNGRLDVCLQHILPRPPFFTGITFYFADLPKVALTLEGTVMGLRVSLAWLEKLLADIIQKQLAEQIVLPTVATVLLDITNEDAWFEAGGVVPEGVMTVCIHGARGLAAKDVALPFGLSRPSSDPYCLVAVGGKPFRTPTRPQNLNPEWRTHKFLVYSLTEQLLTVDLYDENPYVEDTFLGSICSAASDVVKADGRELELTGPGAQGMLRLSTGYAELKLDDFNLRQQLRALDGMLPQAAAFVVLVGIDCCTFPDEPVEEDAKKRGSFVCKVTCEEHEQAFRSRTARKQGRYGATAWWRLDNSEQSSLSPPSPAVAGAEEDDEDCLTAHFQSTFTHMLLADPRSVVCHIKLEKRGGLPGVGNVVGEVDFPVYRLIHASANTSKAVLRVGPAQLSVLAQLRATEAQGSSTRTYTACTSGGAEGRNEVVSLPPKT
eukprot:s78_g36.t1